MHKVTLAQIRLNEIEAEHGDALLVERSIAQDGQAVCCQGHLHSDFDLVRRQNIWLRLGLRLGEFRPHHGVDIKRRSCGAASVDVG